jgi:hypothetical protein
MEAKVVPQVASKRWLPSTRQGNCTFQTCQSFPGRVFKRYLLTIIRAENFLLARAMSKLAWANLLLASANLHC